MPNNVVELIFTATDKFSGPSNKILGTLQKLAVGFAAAFSFKKIIDSTIEAQNAVSQLGVAYGNAAESANRSKKEILDFSAATQRASIFSDEAVTRAQTTLLRFGRLQGPVFDAARKSIVDVASALHIDLESAASSVGRALESPAQGMRQLRQLGIIFSEDQRKVIQSLEATGKVGEAQAIILDTLKAKFGGAAEAARNTLGGALSALKNAFEDLFESTDDGANKVADGLNKITDILNDPKFKESIQEFSSDILKFLSMFLDIINESIKGWKFLISLIVHDAPTALDELFKKQSNLGASLNNAMEGLTQAKINNDKLAERHARELIARIKAELATVQHDISIVKGTQGGVLAAGTSGSRKGSGGTFVPQATVDRENADALAAYNKQLEDLLKNVNSFDPRSLIHPLPAIDEETIRQMDEAEGRYDKLVKDLEDSTAKVPEMVAESLKRADAPIQNFVDSFKNAFQDAINTGSFTVRKFVQYLIAELSKKAIFNAIDKIGDALRDALSAKGSGGSSGGGIIAGLRAVFGFAGGGRTSGAPFWAGEEGRELIVPTGPMQVYNKRQLAGMGGGTNVTFNNVINVSGGGGSQKDNEKLAATFQVAMTRNNIKQRNEMAKLLERNGFGRVR